MILTTPDTVLLVVDMQNGFLGSQSRHITPNVKRLVELFVSRAVPIVFTRFRNDHGSQFETLIGWRRLREPPETDIVADLQPLATVVLDKTSYTSLTREFFALPGASNWKHV